MNRTNSIAPARKPMMIAALIATLLLLSLAYWQSRFFAPAHPIPTEVSGPLGPVAK